MTTTYGICPLSVVPLRNAPSHKSEMLSQLLFGELVEILEFKGRQWTKVRCQWDNFVGWVSSDQIKWITPSEFQLFQKHFAFNLELVQPVMADNHFVPITLGSQLPNFDGIHFKLENTSYTFSGLAVFPGDYEADAEFVLKIARRYLNSPYLLGGRSPFGIDSSGFIQIVFKMAGFRLPREVSQQVHQGTMIDFIEQALPGDVAFFENPSGRITHAGILMPDNQIIHVSGQVKTDTIDHFGIFCPERSRYTHRLRVIKRILPVKEQPRSLSGNNSEKINRQVELF